LRILANELQWFVNLYNDIQRVRDAIAENQEDQ